MLQCPRCQSSTTPLMNACVNCGFPLKRKVVPHFDTSNNSYIPQTDYVEKQYHYQSNQPYANENEKPKANGRAYVLFLLFLGPLSALGYYLIATSRGSTGKNICGVILIIISVIINLVFWLGWFGILPITIPFHSIK